MDKKPYPFTQVQLDWIKALREHPERQHKGSLGHKDGETLKLCCLGQALLCIKPDPDFDKLNNLLDKEDDGTIEEMYLNKKSYKALELNGCTGPLKQNIRKDGTFDVTGVASLAGMNDTDWTWPEIADYIEQNPENVFTNHLKNT